MSKCSAISRLVLPASRIAIISVSSDLKFVHFRFFIILPPVVVLFFYNRGPFYDFYECVYKIGRNFFPGAFSIAAPNIDDVLQPLIHGSCRMFSYFSNFSCKNKRASDYSFLIIPSCVLNARRDNESATTSATSAISMIIAYSIQTNSYFPVAS